MGYDFMYLLYFPRKRLWDVLIALSEIAEPSHHPDVKIHFPDQDLLIPNIASLPAEYEWPHDAESFWFSSVYQFDADNAILQYKKDGWVVLNDHNLQATSPPEKIGIGYINLHICTDLQKELGHQKSTDLVFFRFSTSGTRMSLLFQYSTSIRKAFTSLLERFQGVCGIFYNESDFTELFWFKGKPDYQNIPDAWMPPDEIANLLAGADHTDHWGGR
jgi:hypothetical protein